MDKRITIFFSAFTMMIVIVILHNSIKHLAFSPPDQTINEQSSHIIQEMKGKTKQSEDNLKESKLMESKPSSQGKKEETVKLNHEPMNLEAKNDGMGNISEMLLFEHDLDN